MSGTQVRLAVPSGHAHDVWTAGDQAPRIMQAVADTDFAVEVKFDSVVSQQFQLQGLIVEQKQWQLPASGPVQRWVSDPIVRGPLYQRDPDRGI